MSARNALLADLGLIEPEEAEWRNHANCIGVGPAVFFPKRGHSAAPAKDICAGCPVWSPCLEYALREHDRLSVAGGRTEKERRVILRARRLGIPGYGPGELAPPEHPHRSRTDWRDAPDEASRQFLRRLQGAA